MTDARARLAEVVEQVLVEKAPVYLTRHSRPVAAVVDAGELERLVQAAEDLEDIMAARAAREEIAAGVAAVPWDEVKRDLGLV